MLEYASRPLEQFEDPYEMRAGRIGIAALEGYVTPKAAMEPETEESMESIRSAFSGIRVGTFDVFGHIEDFDSLRRALTSAILISAITPEYAGKLYLPRITEDTEDTYASLMNQLMESGRRQFNGFVWYERFQQTRELAMRLGPVTVASGSLSPYPFNEDAYGYVERWSKGTYGQGLEGVYVVADGMINRAYRDRNLSNPRSLAGHRFVREFLAAGTGRFPDDRETVRRINRLLFMDNMKHGRFGILDRHGTAFTAARVGWDGNDKDAMGATVRFVQTGDTAATLARYGQEPGEIPDRIPGLPKRGFFLGMSGSLPPDAVCMTETHLYPGDTLALWTDGVANLPPEIMKAVIGCPEASAGEIRDMLLWGSAFNSGTWGHMPDEQTAVVIRLPA